MNTIKIPTHINADGLLPFLAVIGKPMEQGEIVLDFHGLKRVSPAGLTALVATVLRWKTEGRKVEFVGLQSCSITGYLQRMDALAVCGIDWPENFRRRDAHARFVPVTFVDSHVEEMGNKIAACLAPGGDEYEHPMADLYDFSWYVLTEIANNIRQHSAGTGYAAAQASREEGYVRLALADNGMGIRGSFRHAGYPWSEAMDDALAIAKALEVRISCKSGDPNEGVGLTLVSELAKIAGAWLMIVSGNGVLTIKKGGEPTLSTLPNGGCYQGTLMTLVFPRRLPQNYPQMLTDAKTRAGLLRPRQSGGRFQK